MMGWTAPRGCCIVDYQTTQRTSRGFPREALNQRQMLSFVVIRPRRRTDILRHTAPLPHHLSALLPDQSQVTVSLAQAEQAAAEAVRGTTYDDQGEPYGCTSDCSGYDAGYRWADENQVLDPSACGGNSQSFIVRLHGLCRGVSGRARKGPLTSRNPVALQHIDQGLRGTEVVAAAGARRTRRESAGATSRFSVAR
jgi:hypothetical protein